jgi:hypothetical protein
MSALLRATEKLVRDGYEKEVRFALHFLIL